MKQDAVQEHRDGDEPEKVVSFPMSAFAHAAMSAEAEREGVSLEQLLAHAAMYYLADVDSGRMARRARAVADLAGEG